MSRKTRKLKSKLLVPFEWIGIAFVLCVIPWLSRRALFGLCDCLSRVMYAFDRRSMARAVGYAFWTIRRARERCAGTGEMDARGKAFLAANGSAVTVSGHIGCWEILSQLVFLADLEWIVRRHPSCWILNYNYFSTMPPRMFSRRRPHRRNS